MQVHLAALNDIQRLRIGPETIREGPVPSLVVTKTTFPIGMEEHPSGLVNHFISLFQYNGIVQASPLVSSDDLTSRTGGYRLDFDASSTLREL